MSHIRASHVTHASRVHVLTHASPAQWDARCYGNKDEHRQHNTMWNKYQNAIGFVVTNEPAIAKCKQNFEISDTNLRQADMIARGFPFRRDRDVALASFPLVLEPSGGELVCIHLYLQCLCACLCVCVRACMCVCVCVCVQCIHIYIYIQIHLHVYMYMAGP